MAQADYILRMIEQMGQMLARLSHQVERGYGGSRLTTDLMVPATRLLMQRIVTLR